MIVRLKHEDGRLMGFACMAFNVLADGQGVNFVSPTGKELEWEGVQMDVIEEMTIHYDSGVLIHTVKGPEQFKGAQSDRGGAVGGSRHDDMSGRSTAGMGG